MVQQSESLKNTLDRNLALEVVRVTEAAALSAARLMGRGEKDLADQAAVEAMRKAFEGLRVRGTVVIGEGERDEAPMLFIGEQLGRGGDDAWGFGFFPGQYGMVVYSRFPIETDAVRTFQRFRWTDMPGNLIPRDYYDSEEREALRLSSKSHWDVPVRIGGKTVHVLAAVGRLHRSPHRREDLKRKTRALLQLAAILVAPAVRERRDRPRAVPGHAAGDGRQPGCTFIGPGDGAVRDPDRRGGDVGPDRVRNGFTAKTRRKCDG